jgi:hypothetical protein
MALRNMIASRDVWVHFTPRLGFTFETVYKAFAQQAVRIADLRLNLCQLLVQRHSLIKMISIEVRRHYTNESSSRLCSCVRRTNRDADLYFEFRKMILRGISVLPDAIGCLMVEENCDKMLDSHILPTKGACDNIQHMATAAQPATSREMWVDQWLPS